MGSSVGFELLHAGILDANLFSQELDLLLKPIIFCLSSELTVHALRRPTLGQRQGGSGQGNDLDDRRADATGPASGEREGMGQGNWGHEPSPGRALD